MKTTRIWVRAFNHHGSVTLKRKEYLSLQDAIEYIEKEISDTGSVEKVEHLEDGEIIKTLKNKDFVRPFELNSSRAASFLSNHLAH